MLVAFIVFITGLPDPNKTLPSGLTELTTEVLCMAFADSDSNGKAIWKLDRQIGLHLKFGRGADFGSLPIMQPSDTYHKYHADRLQKQLTVFGTIEDFKTFHGQKRTNELSKSLLVGD